MKQSEHERQIEKRIARLLAIREDHRYPTKHRLAVRRQFREYRLKSRKNGFDYDARTDCSLCCVCCDNGSDVV